MKKQPSVILVTPRFENGNFAGYNQVAGNVYFDTDGHLYPLVSVEDYNKVQDERDEAIGQLEIDKILGTIPKEFNENFQAYFDRSERRKQKLQNTLYEVKEALLKGSESGGVFWRENAISLIDQTLKEEKYDDSNS